LPSPEEVVADMERIARQTLDEVVADHPALVVETVSSSGVMRRS
jgi:hypothetical protein